MNLVLSLLMKYADLMRLHEGQEFFTIGEVASALGVSEQTLRVWEAKNLLNTVRSPGGQRLYSHETFRRVKQIIQIRRTKGWNSAAISTALSARPDTVSASGLPRHGDNLRRARRARNMTLKELALEVGISSRTLSSYERHEALISSAIISRLADALLVPMSLLGSSTVLREEVFRHEALPKTIIEGDVMWEELGSQGHDMEPAILTVPPGRDSGGAYSRPGEIFVYVLEGVLLFSVNIGELRRFELAAGDAITAPPRTVIEWSNGGPGVVRAIWIENLLAAR